MSTQAGDVVADRSSRRRRIMPRFGLLTLMLLIAAVAVWMGYWQTTREIERMRRTLPGLRDAARQLRVEFAEQYAVVRKHELWNDDFRWDVYLPRDNQYVMRLATEQVDVHGLAEPAAEVAIAAGRHAIQLVIDRQQDRWQVEVIVDGHLALQDSRPLTWDAGRGSSGGAAFDNHAQDSVDHPLVLFRRRFMTDQGNGSYSTPRGPTAGVLLWIEQSSASASKNHDPRPSRL